jgi:hypothetical protein
VSGCSTTTATITATAANATSESPMVRLRFLAAICRWIDSRSTRACSLRSAFVGRRWSYGFDTLVDLPSPRVGSLLGG